MENQQLHNQDNPCPQKSISDRKFVIFDLDGTLIDSFECVLRCVNKALRYYNLTMFSHRTSFSYKNLNKLLNLENNVFNCNIKNKFDEFHESDYIESTHIIESSARLLKEYCEENVSIVIVTNKKETIAKKCLSYFFPSYSFLLIGRTGITAIKNDHQLVKARLNELGCNTTDIIAYYGDSEEDAVLASHLQINFNKIRNCNENYL